MTFNQRTVLQSKDTGTQICVNLHTEIHDIQWVVSFQPEITMLDFSDTVDQVYLTVTLI